jgi:hypothetical protein
VRRAGAVVLAAAAGLAAVLLVRGAPDPPDAGRAPDVVAVAIRHGTAATDLATGFAAGPGRVVTVAHVVEGGGDVTVRGPGPGGRERAARVLRVDARRDLAVLAVAAGGGAAARTGTATGPVRLLVRRGGRVRAVPARVRRRITAQVSDATGGPDASRPALELAATGVAVGDSGAPVLAGDGRVVGVLFARSNRRPGTAYAVDGSALDAVLGASRGR